MKPRAILSEVPPGSAINARLPGAYFHDSYVISVPDTTRTALSYFLTALANTPPWVNSLMALRNKIVRFVGLKDLGTSKMGSDTISRAYVVPHAALETDNK